MNDDLKIIKKSNFGQIKCAVKISKKFHSGQFRKGPDKEIFYNHPRRVCKCYLGYKYKTLAGVIASLCHDLVEDTVMTETDLEEKFGRDVQKIVMELTKPWDTSSDKYSERITDWDLESKKIKLCDIEDNILSSRDIPQQHRMRMLSRWEKYLGQLGEIAETDKEKKLEYEYKFKAVKQLHSLEWSQDA